MYIYIEGIAVLCNINQKDKIGIIESVFKVQYVNNNDESVSDDIMLVVNKIEISPSYIGGCKNGKIQNVLFKASLNDICNKIFYVHQCNKGCFIKNNNIEHNWDINDILISGYIGNGFEMLYNSLFDLETANVCKS